MIAWGRIFVGGLVNLFASKETPYLRMFMIEYNKEYNHMLKNGYEVTEDVAKNFVKSNT